MGARLKVTGIEELQAAFKELPKAVLKKVVRQALRQGLRPILADARQRVGVDTGALKKSIKLKAGKRTRKAEVSLQILAGEWYGVPEEFGTSKRPGSHAIRSAFDAGATRAARTIEAELEAGIARETKALGKS